MTFVNIFLFILIHCLVAVCQPFIKLLLTYLLTYLPVEGVEEFIYLGSKQRWLLPTGCSTQD